MPSAVDPCPSPSRASNHPQSRRPLQTLAGSHRCGLTRLRRPSSRPTLRSSFSFRRAMSMTRRRQPLLWLPSDGHDRAAGDDGFLLVLLLRRPSNFGARCCSLLRLPHPWASATVRYNSEDTYAHRNLRMLQTEKARRFAKSKRQYIEALVEYAKEEATLSKLRTQLASQQSYIHEDIHSLRRRNSELTDELKDLSLQVQGCLSEIKFHILSHQRLARSCKDSDASSVCYLNTDQLMKCLLSLFDMYHTVHKNNSHG